MDRKIPKEELNRIKRKKWILSIGSLLVIGGVITGLSFLLKTSIKEKDLIIKKAELATLESSVSASGKIVPLYEQAIVSPVSTKILEVYCDEGALVSEGESLLRLDLESAETEYRKLADELSMKQLEIEQTAINNNTYLTDLEMRIRTKEMALDHLKAEVENEKRLDSIGSGTGDRIREAQLAYSTASLELDQMKIQFENEKKSHEAIYRGKQLEGSIYQRNLLDMQRTLEDAKIKAPRKGTVTYINKNLGLSIAPGEKLAVVSDLGHFKVNGEIPEGNAGKLSVGSQVRVRFNRNTVNGRISSISPQSQNGMVEFNVILDEDDDKMLRSGLKTELNVIYDIRDNVVRIPNGQYFQGPGNYYLFIKTEEGKLERRNVTLGDSNFDFVEVKTGIQPGEDVVITDMSDYSKMRSIHLNNK